MADPETLLLIMGLAGSGAMWWRLLPHLARRHRVIVFDNRGTGDSAPAHRPLSMREMAGDAVAVLDAAGVAEAHVMGASMGGMIAQHVALDHGGRVSLAGARVHHAAGSAGSPPTHGCSPHRCCGRWSDRDTPVSWWRLRFTPAYAQRGA